MLADTCFPKPTFLPAIWILPWPTVSLLFPPESTGFPRSFLRKRLTDIQVLIIQSVCFLFLQVKMMFLKKVAGLACNAHNRTAFLGRPLYTALGQGLYVRPAGHPQEDEGSVCKDWDLVKPTISCTIRDTLRSDGVMWWSTWWLPADTLSARLKERLSTAASAPLGKGPHRGGGRGGPVFLRRQFWPCRPLESISGTPGAHRPHLWRLPCAKTEDSPTAPEF